MSFGQKNHGSAKRFYNNTGEIAMHIHTHTHEPLEYPPQPPRQQQMESAKHGGRELAAEFRLLKPAKPERPIKFADLQQRSNSRAGHERLYALSAAVMVSLPLPPLSLSLSASPSAQHRCLLPFSFPHYPAYNFRGTFIPAGCIAHSSARGELPQQRVRLYSLSLSRPLSARADFLWPRSQIDRT